eukprot:CAMPEP_0115265234 /NCGR_PEP_ID=MMETSP0270-20121206/50845_1 /TAXON_ID=71861 /ORGANISM="Scrippsiella trochoidea, Strain CCMP3099" /LENGTH=350 /DNA_ID=CAMNT_0002681289 /DNA_START=139 /DNA_END=1191 /DNA_ORIENTATION=-
MSACSTRSATSNRHLALSCATEQESSDASSPISADSSPVRHRYSMGSGTEHAAGTGNLRWGRMVSEGTYCGCFMRVHQVFDMSTGRFMNVKSVSLVAEGEGEGDGKSRQREQVQVRVSAALRELEGFKHKNLISILGHEVASGVLQIQVERFGVGSIASFLADFGPMKEGCLRRTVRGCLEGLEYLHTRQPAVAHGDVRGANIIMDHSFGVKLADFGCVQLSRPGKELYITAGTLPWKAPEVVQQRTPELTKADLWSLGCTIIEMATGGNPWGEVSLNTLLSLLSDPTTTAAPPIPKHLSECGKSVARSCLHEDPTKRVQAAALLSHEFVLYDASGADMASIVAAGSMGP